MPMSSSPSGKSLWRRGGGAPRHSEGKSYHGDPPHRAWPAAGCRRHARRFISAALPMLGIEFSVGRVDKYLTWGEPAGIRWRRRSKKIRAAAAKKGREVSFGIRLISLSARRTEEGAWAAADRADLPSLTTRDDPRSVRSNLSPSIRTRSVRSCHGGSSWWPPRQDWRCRRAPLGGRGPRGRAGAGARRWSVAKNSGCAAARISGHRHRNGDWFGLPASGRGLSRRGTAVPRTWANARSAESRLPCNEFGAKQIFAGGSHGGNLKVVSGSLTRSLPGDPPMSAFDKASFVRAGAESRVRPATPARPLAVSPGAVSASPFCCLLSL